MSIDSLSSNQRSKGVIILGMHRSGTSVLTAAINSLGFTLGDLLLDSRYDNIKGYFENADIVKFNEKLLQQVESSWDAPGVASSVNWKNLVDSELGQEASQVFDKNFEAEPLWAIKDPRMCLLLPFWTNIFS